VQLDAIQFWDRFDGFAAKSSFIQIVRKAYRRFASRSTSISSEGDRLIGERRSDEIAGRSRRNFRAFFCLVPRRY
jgi:hypothetical protein